MAMGKFLSQARTRFDDPAVGDNTALQGLEAWMCPVDGAEG